MKVSDFDFELPRDRIALRPVRPRDAARLLLVGAELSQRTVAELPQILDPGDLLVLNDTRVLPVRLNGRRGDHTVEVTLIAPDDAAWRAFARPAKRLRPGDRVEFAPGLAAQVIAKLGRGEVVLDFGRDSAAVMRGLDDAGQMPLPPYIRRAADEHDRTDYQTTFARHPGAIAAPTAGLHFTPELFAALDARGIDVCTLTLHVGAATFLPIRGDDTRDHTLEPEWGEVSDEAAAAFNKVRAAGGRIVAVGTTSLRLLESAASERGTLERYRGETTLFITPGYRFRTADMLLTNFHLPRSTLFMLVCAFAGTKRMKHAYAHAVAAGFRFYSYGDASLLHRLDP